MKKIIILILAVMVGGFCQAQDPNPEIFQTWYLYGVSLDLGDTQYYYGDDVPQMTINKDFSFTAIDNCWEISGNFDYQDGDTNYDFFLETLNFEEDCILGGSNGYILKLIYEFNFPVGCYLYEGNYSQLTMETAPGFDHTFRNQITLSIPENIFQNITISPNPAQERISVTGLNEQADKIGVFDITGAAVGKYVHSDTFSYDISHLQTGMYFLQITAQGQTTVKKFLKQ